MRFEAKPFLEKDKTHQLAKFLNVSKERIVQWFASRRYQERQKGLLPKGE